MRFKYADCETASGWLLAARVMQTHTRVAIQYCGISSLIAAQELIICTADVDWGNNAGQVTGRMALLQSPDNATRKVDTAFWRGCQTC